jgi:hypothetical protein
MPALDPGPPRTLEKVGSPPTQPDRIPTNGSRFVATGTPR